ncbi:FAD:protein FMN transferase [Pseudonocardia kujensis]|uniref:FAD:protein FMN transferase n=1 Tax=Pseudonocardia kujensis TaxID=1128675 RepID=UPI001E4D5A0A|nr:FAD:protein FMN transferase [Pseudonocardia kujensis]MCE0768221.1 FAD:protein FMN transferase [Pseudonocardia kujensis]
MSGPVIVAPTAAESFPAIGTTATVVVTDRAALGEAVALLRADLASLDLTCSRFRPDSEIRRAERAAGGTVEVGELLAVHLDAALRAAVATDGLVDPTVGISLDSLGYDRDLADVRDSDDPVRPTPAPGWRRLGWQPEARLLTVPPDVRLDLGSTAKALAADDAAARIAEHTGAGVLVSLGGDLAVAGPAPVEGWQVRITDDHGAPGPGPIVTVRSGGLATSGTARRRWRRGQLACHHVVDPRTGLPTAGPWRTVSVAAASSLAANTAATAALVRGPDATDWLAAAGLPARLVTAAGRVHTVGGWPAEVGPTIAGAV